MHSYDAFPTHDLQRGAWSIVLALYQAWLVWAGSDEAEGKQDTLFDGKHGCLAHRAELAGQARFVKYAQLMAQRHGILE